jgi:hypothetical protein
MAAVAVARFTEPVVQGALCERTPTDARVLHGPRARRDAAVEPPDGTRGRAAPRRPPRRPSARSRVKAQSRGYAAPDARRDEERARPLDDGARVRRSTVSVTRSRSALSSRRGDAEDPAWPFGHDRPAQRHARVAGDRCCPVPRRAPRWRQHAASPHGGTAHSVRVARCQYGARGPSPRGATCRGSARSSPRSGSGRAGEPSRTRERSSVASKISPRADGAVARASSTSDGVAVREQVADARGVADEVPLQRPHADWRHETRVGFASPPATKIWRPRRWLRACARAWRSPAHGADEARPRVRGALASGRRRGDRDVDAQVSRHPCEGIARAHPGGARDHRVAEEPVEGVLLRRCRADGGAQARAPSAGACARAAQTTSHGLRGATAGAAACREKRFLTERPRRR